SFDDFCGCGAGADYSGESPTGLSRGVGSATRGFTLGPCSESDFSAGGEFLLRDVVSIGADVLLWENGLSAAGGCSGGVRGESVRRWPALGRAGGPCADGLPGLPPG